MIKDSVFLKALDETVKEIQDYSEEQLNFQLSKSKNSSFANTVDALQQFNEEFKLNN